MHSIYDAFTDLVEHSDVLLAVYDEADRLRLANDAFRRCFHLAPGETPTWVEIMRRNHAAFRGTAIQAADLEAWLTSTQSRRGKTPFRAYETDLTDGRWLWMTETVRPNGWMLCVAGRSMAMSIRSSSGPESLAWYCAMQRSFGWRRQA